MQYRMERRCFSCQTIFQLRQNIWAAEDGSIQRWSKPSRSIRPLGTAVLSITTCSIASRRYTAGVVSI